MKPRDYCCCAIPIVNAGIYATLTEQLVLSLLVGILSLATPSIVGAATPSFAPWILAIVCFVAAGIQVLGFIGVAREKPILYRRYVSLHCLATLSAFAIAVAWIIVSASRHATAKSKCVNDFFSSDPTQSSEGDILCNIFPWVDVGIMGGLWVLLALLHIYLYVVLSSYGTSQRRDHDKYDQINNDNIPMDRRNDPWDSRPSTESTHSPMNRDQHSYNHVRQESGASVSDMLSQPQQQHEDVFSNPNYAYHEGSYPPKSQSYLDRKASRGGTVTHPTHMYTQEPTPTPQYNDAYYRGPTPHLDRPPTTQAHPAEGLFGRKTPRLTKAQPFNDFK